MSLGGGSVPTTDNRGVRIHHGRFGDMLSVDSQAAEAAAAGVGVAHGGNWSEGGLGDACKLFMPPTIGDASALVLTLLLPAPVSSRSRFLRAAKSLSDSFTFEGCGGGEGGDGEGEAGGSAGAVVEVSSCVKVGVAVGVRSSGAGVVCCGGGVGGRESIVVGFRGVGSSWSTSEGTAGGGEESGEDCGCWGDAGVIGSGIGVDCTRGGEGARGCISSIIIISSSSSSSSSTTIGGILGDGASISICGGGDSGDSRMGGGTSGNLGSRGEGGVVIAVEVGDECGGGERE